MIARILPQSKTFSAIDYNEKKVDKNLGQFIEAYNFGYLELLNTKTAKDYERYFKQWGEKNENIKNKQFHVAISCKGREYSEGELVKIGKRWLSEMGYEGLPTMMYFHKDTPNNHIHIITTRIGMDGKKIDNDNEYYKARNCINKIMNVDLKNICKRDFAAALSYNFDGIRQFEMILNAKKYDTSIIDNKIKIYKEGQLLLTKDIELIEWAKNRNIEYNNDVYKRRNRQIYAIFKKYREYRNLDDFQKLMMNRFKISLVFFGKKEAPYGYAIVDEKDKRVIKGSSIFKLKDLLIPEEKDRIKKIKNTVDTLIEENNNVVREDIFKELRKWGAMLIKNNIINKTTGEVLFTLNEEQIKKINYNFKLVLANSYNVKNEKDREVLAKFFAIKTEDISINNNSVNINISDDKEYYRDILIASEDDKELLHNANIFVVKGGTNDELYMIDKENKIIYSFDELNYQYSGKRTIDIINVRNLEYENNKRDGLDDILDIFLDNNDIGIDLGGGGADNSLKKRKRK